MTTGAVRQPVSAHLAELRSRLFMIAVVFVVGSGIGFSFYQRILAFLLFPLQQPLYYASPAGGFTFVLQVCCFVGFVLSIPMMSYQLVRFIGPALPKISAYFTLGFVFSSCVLAMIGIVFAYFFSLPAALHFLNDFSGDQIHALISTDAYFSFVMIYLGSFALLFQVPLVMLLTNRFIALKPMQLLSFFRWVILLSFIGAGIITPTPDPLNQTIMALPIIILYGFTAMLIWLLDYLYFHRAGVEKIPTNAKIMHIAYTQRGWRQGYLCSWYLPGHSKKRYLTFIDERAYERLRVTAV